MNAAAGNLLTRVMLLQLAVCVVTWVIAFLAVAPRLLLLDADEVQGALWTALYVGLFQEILTVGAVYRRLDKVRYVLRALALGSRGFEADDLVELSTIPGLVTQVTIGSAATVSLTTLVLVALPKAQRWSLRLGFAVTGTLVAAARSAYAPTLLTLVLGLVFLGATAVLVRQRDAYLPDVVRSWFLSFGQLPGRVASLVRALARRRDGAPSSFVARVAPVLGRGARLCGDNLDRHPDVDVHRRLCDAAEHRAVHRLALAQGNRGLRGEYSWPGV